MLLSDKLESLYKEANNKGQVFLEKQAVNILKEELFEFLSKTEIKKMYEITNKIVYLNDVLNKSDLCKEKMIPLDSFLDFFIFTANKRKDKEIEEALKVEKARLNLVRANNE